MTKWQWSVVLALVRYVLYASGYDGYPGAKDRSQRDKDREILIEAANRHINRI